MPAVKAGGNDTAERAARRRVREAVFGAPLEEKGKVLTRWPAESYCHRLTPARTPRARFALALFARRALGLDLGAGFDELLRGQAGRESLAAEQT